MASDLTSDGLKLGGTLVTSNAAELNKLDNTTLHNVSSISGDSGWSTVFKVVYDDSFMIQKSYQSTGNSTGNKTVTFGTSYTTVYGAIPYVIDNGDRHGYLDTNGGPGTSSISCHYTKTGGSSGTSYVFVYSWGVA